MSNNNQDLNSAFKLCDSGEFTSRCRSAFDRSGSSSDSNDNSAAGYPPFSNTGGKSSDQSNLAFIDWLSFSFPLPSKSPSTLKSTAETLSLIRNMHREVLGLPEDAWIETGKGWNGYKHKIDFGHYGFFAYGGESQRGTLFISLNGKGCAMVSDWHKVKQWGESHKAKITRSDLAHDDFEGQTVSIQKAIDWYDQDGFITSGRPPKRTLIDDFDSGDGKTLNIGARENGKFVRIYEKGREQGDKLSPWVRVELELKNKSREIPWDVVVNPGHYLAGAYPCFQFLSVVQQKIKTIQKSVNMTYNRMVGWLKEAAGKAISTMLEVNQGDAEAVVSQILRPGRPRRLQHYEDFDIRLSIQGAL